MVDTIYLQYCGGTNGMPSITPFAWTLRIMAERAVTL